MMFQQPKSLLRKGGNATVKERALHKSSQTQNKKAEKFSPLHYELTNED